MDDLNFREKMAMRILAAMLKIAAPYQDHNFKNQEMVDFIFGSKS